MIILILTEVAPATDAIIQKKIYDSETTFMISNEEIEDIMKIVKSLKKSGLLIQDVSEKTVNEVKEYNAGLPNMLLSTLVY